MFRNHFHHFHNNSAFSGGWYWLAVLVWWVAIVWLIAVVWGFASSRRHGCDKTELRFQGSGYGRRARLVDLVDERIAEHEGHGVEAHTHDMREVVVTEVEANAYIQVTDEDLES